MNKKICLISLIVLYATTPMQPTYFHIATCKSDDNPYTVNDYYVSAVVGCALIASLLFVYHCAKKTKEEQKTILTKDQIQQEFFKAASNGDIQTVKMYIEQNVDINATDNVNQTALLYASLEGHSEIVRLLIEHSALTNVVNENGMTALHCAAQFGYSQIVELLLKNHANSAIPETKYGFTPLHLAVLNNHTHVVRLLLAHGANIEQCDKYGGTPFLYAIFYSNEDIIQLCIENNLNYLPHNVGQLVLNSLANCSEKDIQTLKDLLSAKWEIDDAAKFLAGFTLLHQVTHKGNLESIRLLINAGADINAQNVQGITPLHMAATRKNVEIVQLLIDSGADIQTKDNEGHTPWHYAAKLHDNFEIAELLFQDGLCSNGLDLYGSTALHDAVEEDDIKTVEKLLLQGADVNLKDIFDDTPLFLSHSYEMANLLLAHGADINACDEWEDTLLHHAVEHSVESVKFLLEHGANVNAINSFGETPLMTVATSRCNELSNSDRLTIVSLLLEHGADMFIKNKWNHTIFDFFSATHEHEDEHGNKTVTPYVCAEVQELLENARKAQETKESVATQIII